LIIVIDLCIAIIFIPQQILINIFIIVNPITAQRYFLDEFYKSSKFYIIDY